MLVTCEKSASSSNTTGFLQILQFIHNYLCSNMWQIGCGSYWTSRQNSLKLIPGDLGTRKRPGTSCKIEIHFSLKLLNISLTVLDFYLKFVPDIHFPVQDTDTKFQTVSQKNQGVTSD
jgi:hypothetical protein